MLTLSEVFYIQQNAGQILKSLYVEWTDTPCEIIQAHAQSALQNLVQDVFFDLTKLSSSH